MHALSVLQLHEQQPHLQKGSAPDEGVGHWPIVAGVCGVEGIVALQPDMPWRHL
jgi:hypothetical protein